MLSEIFSRSRHPWLSIIQAGVFVILLTANLYAEGPGQHPAWLVGVNEIFVVAVVDELGQEGYECGLTTDRLKTVVELKLRLAGIPILPDEASLAETRRTPGLLVEVNLQKSVICDFNMWAIFVRVQLRSLVRSPINNELVYSLLWEGGLLGLAEQSQVPELVEGRVEMVLDEFLNDFLAANPKHEPGG